MRVPVNKATPSIAAPKAAKSYEFLTFRLGKPEEMPSVNDAIAAHQDIAVAQGRVALGKTGKALADPTIARALGSASPTLIIITRVKDDFHAHRAAIIDILSSPTKPDEQMIPRYYRHLRNDIKSWIILGPLAILSDVELAQYVLCSNQRLLLDVLRSTRTSNMLVSKPN